MHKCVMLKTFNEVTCIKLLGINDGVTIQKKMFMIYDGLWLVSKFEDEFLLTRETNVEAF